MKIEDIDKAKKLKDESKRLHKIAEELLGDDWVSINIGRVCGKPVEIMEGIDGEVVEYLVEAMIDAISDWQEKTLKEIENF